MFNCIFIKNKLYDYQDNSLSEKEKIKIGAHLEKCPGCVKVLQGIKDVLKAAEQKTFPQPSEDFWHHFKISLDEKLNERLRMPMSLPVLRKYRWKPVLIPALVVLLFFMSSFWYFHQGKLVSKVDSAMVNEIALWEEISPETTMVNGDIFDLDDLANFNPS